MMSDRQPTAFGAETLPVLTAHEPRSNSSAQRRAEKRHRREVERRQVRAEARKRSVATSSTRTPGFAEIAPSERYATSVA